MVNSNVTTITLDGSETKIEFSASYPYYQITNKGDTDIYVSLSPNIVPEAEGVYTVSAGGSEIIGSGYSFSAFYVLGTGKAYIRGKQNAMPASFKIARKGGGGSGGSNLLMLVKNGDMINGLTGFTFLNHANESGAVKSKGADGYIGLIEPFYYTMYKAKSYDSNNPDSLIMSTNEKIDLTNYNYIMFSFFSSTNYGYGNYSDFGGGYFRIDEPENLPIDNTPYNWDGWDVVFTLNQVVDLFIKDISNVKGQHNLCFGIRHGQYEHSYTNYFSINNLLLI